MLRCWRRAWPDRSSRNTLSALRRGRAVCSRGTLSDGDMVGARACPETIPDVLLQRLEGRGLAGGLERYFIATYQASELEKFLNLGFFRDTLSRTPTRSDGRNFHHGFQAN